MNNDLVAIAQETIAIGENGIYCTPTGTAISIQKELAAAIKSSTLQAGNQQQRRRKTP